MQFVVPTLAGEVVSASLLLTVTDSSPDGGTLYPIGNGWTESGITWETAPAVGESPLAAIGPVVAGATIDVPLPPNAVPAGGIFSVALTTTTSNDAWYASRETSTPPQLVLRFS